MVNHNLTGSIWNSKRGVQLPRRLKCGVCERNKATENFSNRQLSLAQTALLKAGKTKSGNLVHKSNLTCRDCSEQRNRLEWTCANCDKCKDIDAFSKSQRSHGDQAICRDCMESVQNLEPHTLRYPEADEDDDEIDNVSAADPSLLNFSNSVADCSIFTGGFACSGEGLNVHTSTQNSSSSESNLASANLDGAGLENTGIKIESVDSIGFEDTGLTVTEFLENFTSVSPTGVESKRTESSKLSKVSPTEAAPVSKIEPIISNGISLNRGWAKVRAAPRVVQQQWPPGCSSDDETESDTETWNHRQFFENMKNVNALSLDDEDNEEDTNDAKLSYFKTPTKTQAFSLDSKKCTSKLPDESLGTTAKSTELSNANSEPTPQKLYTNEPADSEDGWDE